MTLQEFPTHIFLYHPAQSLFAHTVARLIGVPPGYIGKFARLSLWFGYFLGV